MIGYSEFWSIQEPLLSMAAVIEGILHFSGKTKRWRELTADWCIINK